MNIFTALVSSVILALPVVSVPLGDDVSSRADIDSTPLSLVLTRTTSHALYERVSVQWQLENVSTHPVYICQWPGIAFGQSWSCPDGIEKGTLAGYPHSKILERKYFIELKPGEALIGYDHVHVWPTPSGQIQIRAEFRCDQPGEQHELSGWAGSLDSNRVDVEVDKEPDAKSCRRQGEQ